MTRFELTAWHEVKDNGKVMTVDEVIGEMNRLHEENLRMKEQLKQIGEIANRWLRWRILRNGYMQMR